MQRGFTLMELMIAVVVVGVLAAIALPSYRDSVRSSRRADGRNSLMEVQMAQEKYRANNTTYGTLAQIGVSATSRDGHYTIQVTGNTATAYTANAAPAGRQVGDSCGTLTVKVSNANLTYESSGGNANRCWGR